jgi:hypothetical protein
LGIHKPPPSFCNEPSAVVPRVSGLISFWQAKNKTVRDTIRTANDLFIYTELKSPKIKLFY